MSAFMQASTRPDRERIIGARFSLPIDPEPLLLRITGRNGIGEEGQNVRMDAKGNHADTERSVAVIGSGISGLSAAWLLSRQDASHAL